MTIARILVLSGAIALSACDSPHPLTGQAQADAATQTACRRRADDAYDTQNRAQIYSPQSQINTPYSANYLPDQTDRGLSQLFVHDKMVSDCVRNSGTGAERTPPPAATPASAKR